MHVRHLGRLLVATVASAAMSAAAAPRCAPSRSAARTVLASPPIAGRLRLPSRAGSGSSGSGCSTSSRRASAAARPTRGPGCTARWCVTSRGDAVADEEWSQATEGFAREGDLTGEVYALTSHVGDRCFGRSNCDEAVRAMLWRADLARPALRESSSCGSWWRSGGSSTRSPSTTSPRGEASETRLAALGEPVGALAPGGEPDGPGPPGGDAVGLPEASAGSMASWSTAWIPPIPGGRWRWVAWPRRRAPRAAGPRNRARAPSVLVREAIDRGAAGPRRRLLARERLPLQPGASGIAARARRRRQSSSSAPRSPVSWREGWQHPLLPMLSLAEWLATQPQPDLDGALGVADQAVEYCLSLRRPVGAGAEPSFSARGSTSVRAR